MFLIAAVAAVGLGLGDATPVPAELEVYASLSGYNLLWPTARCCAFQLPLKAGGELTTTLQLDEGRVTTKSRVSADELRSLQRVLEQAKFFNLPAEVGSMPVDGDEHRIQVRLGKRAHKVTLFDWPDDWARAPYLSQRELERTRRAYAVWHAIRALVKDPRATVP